MKLQRAGRSTTLTGMPRAVAACDQGAGCRPPPPRPRSPLRTRRNCAVERAGSEHVGAAALQCLGLAIRRLAVAEHERPAAVQVHEDREVTHSKPRQRTGGASISERADRGTVDCESLLEPLDRARARPKSALTGDGNAACVSRRCPDSFLGSRRGCASQSGGSWPVRRVGYLFGCCSLTSKSVEEGICWRRLFAGSVRGLVCGMFGLGFGVGFSDLDADAWLGMLYWAFVDVFCLDALMSVVLVGLLGLVGFGSVVRIVVLCWIA